jgi:hypothetical protein
MAAPVLAGDRSLVTASRFGSTAGRDTATAATPERWSREWLYFALVAAAWCFTPLLRRLLDYRAGAFNPVQITSLIPFFMLLPLAFFVFRKERLARLAPAFRVLAYMWLATFAYGFLIAVAVGSLNAAAFELVQYLVPMLAGLWLAGQELPIAPAMRRLSLIVLPCAAIVALYGIAQWISPPPWDVMWVEGAQFSSVGNPVPFQMRIFATLNSPGPAADFFALTMVLAAPALRFTRLWSWPLLAALGAALMLTLVREAWVGLIVGVAVYLLASPRRFRALPAFIAFGALVLLLAGSLPAMLGGNANADVIVSRVATLGDVGHDESALTRQSEISDALTQGLENPLGTGLGTIGSAAKLGSNPNLIGNILDSGYLARLLELGWLGMLCYLGVVVGAPIVIARALFRAGSRAGVEAKVAGATAVAMCAVLAWADSANDSHLGLDGLFFWLALGLGSLAMQSCSTPAAAPARPVLLQRLTR